MSSPKKDALPETPVAPLTDPLDTQMADDHREEKKKNTSIPIYERDKIYNLAQEELIRNIQTCLAKHRNISCTQVDSRGPEQDKSNKQTNKQDKHTDEQLQEERLKRWEVIANNTSKKKLFWKLRKALEKQELSEALSGCMKFKDSQYFKLAGHQWVKAAVEGTLGAHLNLLKLSRPTTTAPYKYYNQRYGLFSLYDRGVRISEEGEFPQQKKGNNMRKMLRKYKKQKSYFVENCDVSNICAENVRYCHVFSLLTQVYLRGPRLVLNHA
jgi:hypothetical protein